MILKIISDVAVPTWTVQWAAISLDAFDVGLAGSRRGSTGRRLLGRRAHLVLVRALVHVRQQHLLAEARQLAARQIPPAALCRVAFELLRLLLHVLKVRMRVHPENRQISLMGLKRKTAHAPKKPTIFFQNKLSKFTLGNANLKTLICPVIDSQITSRQPEATPGKRHANFSKNGVQGTIQTKRKH